MKYSEFVERLKKEVKKQLKGQYDVTIKTVIKNNGLVREVLSIQPLAGAAGVASVVTLRNRYRPYMSEAEFTACVETIVKNCLEEKEILESYGFKETTVEWENIKEMVYPVLLSTKANWLLLESLVSRPLLDLSVVYMIRLRVGEDKYPIAVRVTETLFEMWDISLEELHQTALENLKKEEAKLVDLENVLKATLLGMEPPLVETMQEEKVYILSNSVQYYGVSMILNQEYLRKISGGKSMYILPSTIHEVILILDSEELDMESMNEMAQSANDEVADEEQFQDHAYYYDGETGEIRSCK